MVQKEPFIKTLLKVLNKPANTAPPTGLPSVKRDLKTMEIKPTLTWFGHSSYLLTLSGRTILVDPVFSGHASPFAFMVKNFKGSNVYGAEDMPEIDLLIITHDHYDHMDYGTLKRLKHKIKQVICPLGVGSHLTFWGYDVSLITELDWWQTCTTNTGLELIATPSRHFSGRSLRRARTLWSSFVLKSENTTIYIGGDSGYDKHFKEIGEKYGPFDLAILETGQYNTAWAHIHMMPEEAVQASKDLRASYLLPVHWAKFALAFHPWNEPIERVVKAAAEMNQPLVTPLIGEQVILNEYYPIKKWWRALQPIP